MLIERAPVSHVISDVRLSGPFAFEGLDFILHVRRYSPATRIILMTGSPTDELKAEAEKRGAVAFLPKPFTLDALESVMKSLGDDGTLVDQMIPALVRLPGIEEILQPSNLAPFFQPIVRIDESSPKVYAYESLARLRVASAITGPAFLFDYAERKRRTTELEHALIERALEHGVELSHRGFLFLNTHPTVFNSGVALRDRVMKAATKFKVDPKRIVFEITEQASLSNNAPTFEALDALRAEGMRFAFDDVGIAYSHLPFIDRVRPSYLKISQLFGTGFETDATKTKLVRNLISLANEFSCELIMEGVETASTAFAARAIGVKLAQGYFYGKPAAVEELLGEQV